MTHEGDAENPIGSPKVDPAGQEKHFPGQAGVLQESGRRLQEVIDIVSSGEPLPSWGLGDMIGAATQINLAAQSLHIAQNENPTRESVSSRSPNEQLVAGNPDYDNICTVLDIPKENWNEPKVQEFVGLYDRMEKLLADFSIASSQHLNRFGPNGESLGVASTGKPEKLAQLRDLFGAPDMQLSLSQRYEIAELFLRGIKEALMDGFGGGAARYIKNKLNVALKTFRLEVSETKSLPDDLSS